jgi:hypothetical protein
MTTLRGARISGGRAPARVADPGVLAWLCDAYQAARPGGAEPEADPGLEAEPESEAGG